jgi:hypothetical protein
MSRLEKRVTGVESRIGMPALDAYRNLPLQQWPDWALASVIIGRRVTPAEMRSLEHDHAFWLRIEEIARANEEGPNGRTCSRRAVAPQKR